MYIDKCTPVIWQCYSSDVLCLNVLTQMLMSVLRVGTPAAHWLNVPTLWGAMSVTVSLATREMADPAQVKFVYLKQRTIGVSQDSLFCL